MRPLILFLVLGVLAPTGAVLWFMNQAARVQAESARQSVTEAYRGQMRLLRDRVEQSWKDRSARLDGAFSLPETMKGVGADSAVKLDERGGFVYPVMAKVDGKDPLAERADWVSAQMTEGRRQFLEAADLYGRIVKADRDRTIRDRAAQAQIRCLLAAGKKDLALAAIRRHFGSGDFAMRPVELEERVLALTQYRRDAAAEAEATRLGALLALPHLGSLPTAQRLFLLEQLGAPRTPLLDAERLALSFAERNERAGAAGLQRTGLPDVWMLPSRDRRALALYRTATIAAMPVAGPDARVKYALIPPGGSGGEESIAAGEWMPGWRLGLTLLDTSAFDEAAGRRRATQLWIGYAVVAALVVTGLVAGQAFGRQMKLARLKTDLVAAVSHELKTPLASMRLLVDSLLEDGATDAQKTREYLELISGENARLTRLIENFLAFSRIERNRQRFEFAPVRPERVAEAAVAAMQERGEGIAVEVAANLPAVRADEDALVTALLNLLDNAYKYTAPERKIALRASREGEGVAFAVSDNGIGIAPREQKRIFRRFYQVDRRLARAVGGCGLGLSIVEYVARAHGGSVRVESAEGGGSTFTVWAPRAGEAE